MPPMASRRTDAARRFTDLYQKAVDQLGNGRAPVRVGGLYALELLGQEHPRHRSAIIDLICAYLRMPFPSLAPFSGDELQVRLAAQRIIAAHLHPADQTRFWPGVGLDLTGAPLVDFDLSGCRLDGPVRFDRAEFHGPARLRGSLFAGEASFRFTIFHAHAWLERTRFAGPARFDGADFRGDSWFGETTFATQAVFVDASFAGHAWFGGATLAGPAHFAGASFARSVGFRGATFRSGTAFDRVTFNSRARVSRQGDGWNLCPDGWRVEIDPDNWGVGDLVSTRDGATVQIPGALG